MKGGGGEGEPCITRGWDEIEAESEPGVSRWGRIEVGHKKTRVEEWV